MRPSDTGMLRHAAPDHLRLRPAAGHARHLRCDGLRRARAAAGLVLFLAALALAACGPLPRPFQPERKGGNDLLVLPDRTGVTVASVTGALPDGAAMAKAMARALRRQNVPADVGVGNQRTHWLMGAAEPLPGSGDGEVRRRFVWELFDSEGELITRTQHRVRVPTAAWQAGDPKALARVAAEAAPELAATIQGPTVAETDLPGFPVGTRLVVERVVGGPPELARALARALAERLRQRDLPLADRAQPGDIVVAGDLSLADPGADGRRRLELVWTVRRQGRDGQLGDLRQANTVAQAQIAQQPQRLAGLIAQAAAPGVLQVLEGRAR